MCFDFSSTFNAVQTLWVGNELTEMQMDAPKVSWITDHLTSGPQFVSLRQFVFSMANAASISPSISLIFYKSNLRDRVT